MVPGVVILRTNGDQDNPVRTLIRLPKNRYDRIGKALNQNNEHVLAFAGNFAIDADSHYASQQNDEGQHQTQLVKCPTKLNDDQEPQLTGASFIVRIVD